MSRYVDSKDKSKKWTQKALQAKRKKGLALLRDLADVSLADIRAEREQDIRR